MPSGKCELLKGKPLQSASKVLRTKGLAIKVLTFIILFLLPPWRVRVIKKLFFYDYFFHIFFLHFFLIFLYFACQKCSQVIKSNLHNLLLFLYKIFFLFLSFFRVACTLKYALRLKLKNPYLFLLQKYHIFFPLSFLDLNSSPFTAGFFIRFPKKKEKNFCNA